MTSIQIKQMIIESAAMCAGAQMTPSSPCIITAPYVAVPRISKKKTSMNVNKDACNAGDDARAIEMALIKGIPSYIAASPPHAITTSPVRVDRTILNGVLICPK